MFYHRRPAGLLVYSKYFPLKENYNFLKIICVKNEILKRVNLFVEFLLHSQEFKESKIESFIRLIVFDHFLLLTLLLKKPRISAGTNIA